MYLLLDLYKESSGPYLQQVLNDFGPWLQTSANALHRVSALKPLNFFIFSFGFGYLGVLRGHFPDR